MQAGAEAIITRDPRGFDGTPPPALARADLLAEMKATKESKTDN
jgi:hypothetical protein